MKQILLIVSLALSLTACNRESSDNKPLFEKVETFRYAADTTGGGLEPGELRQSIIENYDEMGNVVFSEYRTADDEVQMQFVSTVEGGVRTRTDWRRKDGSLALFVLFKYDDQDRVIESIQYAPDSTLRRGFVNRWADDGLGRETGPLPDENGRFEPNSFYKLNARGEDLELLEFPDVDSLRTLFTYDYPERDAYGNWTTRHTRRDGVPSRVETRTLVYRDR